MATKIYDPKTKKYSVSGNKYKSNDAASISQNMRYANQPSMLNPFYGSTTKEGIDTRTSKEREQDKQRQYEGNPVSGTERVLRVLKKRIENKNAEARNIKDSKELKKRVKHLTDMREDADSLDAKIKREQQRFKIKKYK